jgi:predicted DNA-binding WGR domain protein
VGQSKFRCDLAVRGDSDGLYRLGILVDTDGHYSNPNLLDRYLMQPSILQAFGWCFAMVLTKDWYHNPEDVLARLEKLLKGEKVTDDAGTEDEPPPEPAPAATAHPVQLPTIPPAEPTPAPTPPANAAASPTAPARHFEFISDSSRKFWEISVSGNSFTVRFGRIGTAGQSQAKGFATEEKARQEADSLIAEKVKKGYIEKAA